MICGLIWPHSVIVLEADTAHKDSKSGVRLKEYHGEDMRGRLNFTKQMDFVKINMLYSSKLR